MRWLLFFAAVSVAFAQLDTDTFTITSLRTLNVVVDQVQVTVYVNSGIAATLDDVVSALQGTGITAANLSGAYTFPSILQQPRPTQWTFTLTGSISKLKDTLAALARVQKGSDIDLSYYLNAVTTPSDPCPWPSLVGDAQAQAQKLAAVAGVRVGPIVALSEGFTGLGIPVAAQRAAYALQIVTIYDPFSSPVGFSSFLLGAVTPASSCALTVQFKLLR